MKIDKKKYLHILSFSFCTLVYILCLLCVSMKPNLLFGETEVRTNAKQVDKSPNAQESTKKNTSSFPGFIKGKVFNNLSGVGVTDAVITINRGGTIVSSVESASDGTYFLQILPGSYDINVTRNGFFDSNERIVVSAFITAEKDINMAPTVSLPSTPPPSGEPGSSECLNGGTPSGIALFPPSLTMRQGATKRVRIRVLKNERAGCPIDVLIDCITGCDAIELSKDLVSTNKRGFAIAEIQAKRDKDGVSAVMFRAGNVDVVLPIEIVGGNK